MIEIFSEKGLMKDLKLEARALEIPSGAAEIFIEKAIAAAKTKINQRKIITEQDVTRIVATELRKYHKDLAYVYENRDKII